MRCLGALQSEGKVLRYIKLFGERNSGTTWLEKLIRHNLDAKLLIITAEKIRKRGGYRGRADFEGAMDHFFLNEGRVNFGWKHRAVSVSSLVQRAKYPDTAFIFLTKDPYWFVRSLWRNPYNRLARNTKKLELSQFAQKPWPLLARDEIDGESLTSPFKLWSHKVRSYLETVEGLPTGKATLIRYEDVLVDPESELRKAAATLGVDHGETFRNWETDTKGGSAYGADYYKQRYLSANYSDFFDEAALEMAARDLDRDLLDRLGYSLASETAEMREETDGLQSGAPQLRSQHS